MQTIDKTVVLTFNISSVYPQNTECVAAGQCD